MKELMGTARNIFAVIQDGKAIPTIEVIFMVVEPQFHIDAGGELIRSRVPETLRFTTTPAGLRKVMADFGELADEAEEILDGLIDDRPRK